MVKIWFFLYLEMDLVVYEEDEETETGQHTYTAEEVKTLLDKEDDDVEMKEKEEEDMRRRAEKEAEIEDQRQEQRLIEERRRRRKLEQERKEEEKRQTEAKLARAEEEDRLKEEQIRKLEADLTAARAECEKRKRLAAHSRCESEVSSVSGSGNLSFPPGYKAVKSSKIASLAVRHLNGGAAQSITPIGSFSSENDARFSKTNLISDANSLRNISSSFVLETFSCNTCSDRGEHAVLGKKAEGSDGTQQSPPCFVLSDQNFPPLVPVEGEGDCLKIIQVENASLSDLTTVFLAAVEGFAMPAGSVVLICSISHLAAVGTAAYAEDLVRALKAVRAAYGNGVTVMHGIPFLMHGVNEHSTIRALLEIEQWYKNVSASNAKEISSTHDHLVSTLKKAKATSDSPVTTSTPGQTSAPERFLLKMPQNLFSYEKMICISEGFGDQLSLCQPISEGEERVLLESLLNELNEKCGLELSYDITIGREASMSEEDNLYEEEHIEQDPLLQVIMVGDSHGVRTTEELDREILDVTDISEGGWRISENGVEAKAAELRELLEGVDESRTTIVYQLFDNSSYWCRRDDGSRMPPEKIGDGSCHVNGELEIATKDETKRLVSTALPLLRAGGQCRKLILTPAPRFKRSSCCDNKKHCSNRHDKGYASWMEGRLAENRTTIRDYVKMRNIKRATVVQFCGLIGLEEGRSNNLQVVPKCQTNFLKKSSIFFRTFKNI